MRLVGRIWSLLSPVFLFWLLLLDSGLKVSILGDLEEAKAFRAKVEENDDDDDDENQEDDEDGKAKSHSDHHATYSTIFLSLL